MARFGISVWLTDRNSEVIDDAILWMKRIGGDSADSGGGVEASRAEEDRAENEVWLARVHSAGGISDLANAEVYSQGAESDSSDLTVPLTAAMDLVLECVPEQISLKKRVLRQLSELFPPPCIIASNSSYFVPSVLSAFVKSPERFAHLHFHVPVLRESVADIVGCDVTEPWVLERLAGLSERIEQYPLKLRHENPGYVFNWLLQAVLKAALELVHNDVVDPADVDRSWKAVTNMPVGPFGMMDRIGIDVVEQVLANARWSDVSSVSEADLMQVLKPLVDAGRLGVKSKAGFYDYGDDQLQH